MVRSISVEDVRAVVDSGEIIKEYPDDTPYPSRLLLGWVNVRPLHVVAADNPVEGEMIVITAYEPDPAQWEPDFKRRRT
jgi:hypothetical protein